MVPLIAAGIAATANLAASKMSASAAEEAARKQAAAQQAALDYTKQLNEQTQQRLSPYVTAGQGALGRYEDIASGMQQPTFGYQQQAFDFNKFQDPNAQYIMQQAAKALNASSIAKGATGGGAVSAPQAQAGNLANQAYAPAYQRWMDTSNMLNSQEQQRYGRSMDWLNTKLGANQQLMQAGQNAANTMGGFGQQQAQLGSGLMSSIGATRGAGTLGAANAWSGGINSIGNALEQAYGYGKGVSDTNSAATYDPTKYVRTDFAYTPPTSILNNGINIQGDQNA